MEKVLRFLITIILTVAAGLMPGCNKSNFAEDNFSPVGLDRQGALVDIETSHEQREPESVISHLEDNVAKLTIEDAQEPKTESAETAEPTTAKEPELRAAEEAEQKVNKESTSVAIENTQTDIKTVEGTMLEVIKGPAPGPVESSDVTVTDAMGAEGLIEEPKPATSETTDQEVEVVAQPKSVLSHLQNTLGGGPTESKTNPATQNERVLVVASEMGEAKEIEKVLKETQSQAAQETQQETVEESKTVVAKKSRSEKGAQTIHDAIRDILSANRE